MGKFSGLFFVLMLAISIILAAGCSQKEEPVTPTEGITMVPEPEENAEEAKPEEAAKPFEAPASEKKW
jgi:hypothetical protein